MKDRNVKISTGQRLPQGNARKPAMTRGDADQDAIALLKADHREVAERCEDYENADPGARPAIAQEICTALTIHARIEEEILYPEAREALDEEDRELVNEADVEHASVKQLVAEIEAASPDDEHYDARVTVLGEYVRHHVEEEEKQLFPKLRECGLDLDELGARLAARKAELEAGAEGVEHGPGDMAPARH